MGFNSHWGDHFLGTIHLDQKPGAKRDDEMFQATWHCCMCYNPANGRVEFEDGKLKKSNFITKNGHEACQLTRTKDQQKNNFFLVMLSKSWGLNKPSFDNLYDPNQVGALFFEPNLWILKKEVYFKSTKAESLGLYWVNI